MKMKQTPATLQQLIVRSKRHGLITKVFLIAIAVLTAVALPMQLSSTPEAHADKYDEMIAAIQLQRDQYDAKAAELAQQADSLKNKKAILQNQQASIQQQIDLSQAQYEKLKRDIALNEQKILENRDALGQIIADMYVDDTVSPLEMLASSDNIADYVDKQEYRSTVRDNLTVKIDEINALKEELEKQQEQVASVLEDQKEQRAQLAAKISEYNALVAQTQNQQSAYQQLSAKAAAEQQELRDQQQAAIAAALAASGAGGSAIAGDPGRGGYPNNLANAPQDSIVDPWGMYNRECVSYVAWKVYQKNNYMPYWGGHGNANQWPSNARAAGIPMGSTPKVGSVGVIYAGPYGHVVWVNSINPNGTINISQYNYNFGSGPGMYSEMYNVSPSAYSVYIYF
ncbi:CHAP domain-containing protein [Candidatus Saccharibacteria bacterium]|nr:CHAP domain-containing protein [Candidatus Saccharibacteria bacterium]